MPVAGPFYLAMVDETETTFGTEHLRMDEYVFSAKRTLSEGAKPKLELVIENPRVGLLSALRKQHCWFAWDSNWGGTPNVIPLFFGRIVGIPTDLQSEVITITFISWPDNYRKQLQSVAEGMKTLPFFDPVFTDVSLRDDPMAIFESHSKLVCIDPVTNVVTASDILVGEDGNVNFTESDHFYGSLKVSPGAVPKTAVHVDATVSWTQTARGYLEPYTLSVNSYTGDAIIGDWPKPGAQIAAGLTVFESYAVDTARVDRLESRSITMSWTNRDKVHNDGDALSSNTSITYPINGIMTAYTNKTGILDPYAVDGDGDPSPTNIPPSLNASYVSYYAKSVAATMTLEYQAARPHSERLIFTLFADVQPTTLDPLVSEDSETITITGSDVGMPIVDLLNWTTVSGTHVNVGMVIFPDDPQLPGGRTAQRATVAGTAGLVAPDFSDVFGEETIDGGVTWVSLGVAQPTESAPDWTRVSHVPEGTVILPRRPFYLRSSPAGGVELSEGQYVQSGGSFVVGTGGGSTATIASLPTGSNYFIATTGGITGTVIPAFNNTMQSTTADGTVVWTAIATGDIPIGGTPGNITRSSYFATDRGQQSIGHLICRARARLRFASRVVAASFQCSFLRGTELTLRKTATLHDHRLPGGLILGKVVGTDLVASSSGTFTCTVNIASSVGYGNVVSEVAGAPTYVQDGYMTSGQTRTNKTVVLPFLSDVGYTPIIAIPDEDGITFPLTKRMITVLEAINAGTGFVPPAAGVQIHGDIALSGSGVLGSGFTNPDTILSDGTIQKETLPPTIPQDNDFWYELILKPLNGNGTFSRVYHLKCTDLQIEQMINLQEESTT